ncbi:MAG: hypothetical protein L6R42_008200, partial [Xanthoria sp. 1 TBL-2021]
MTTSITGDVAYDAFLNPSCNGPGDKHIYEIMVWLAKLGTLRPIGSPTSPAGIQLAGHSGVDAGLKMTSMQAGFEVSVGEG